MANESRQINVGELDFDQIKSNLKTYLRAQTEFQDYNFEGSALSVLLDVLAYNTHYTALYNNMAINELFLDSATKRNSVVSRAKELGYIPHSAISPTAVIDVIVTAGTTTPNTLTLPKGSPFNTSIDNVGYTFYTTENITVPYSNGVYLFSDVQIKEGSPLTYYWTIADTARYVIPNSGVDLSTLVVRVKENISSTQFTTYVNAESIINVTGDDNVYYVKEIDNQLYEITFGDGVLGSKPANGKIAFIEYIVTNRAAANGAKVFTYNGSSLLSGSVVSLTLKTAAYGGSDVESVDSIKFNAPKAYNSQNRAVTTDDYKSIIYNNFPEAQSVSIWGGEDNNPPVYGKTFICIKPKTSDVLTQQQKSYIANEILSSRSMVSIIPEFVDPEYIRIALDVSVYYNELETPRSSSDIATLVYNTISNYNNTDLERFDSIFRFSKVSRLIDVCEPSIINNITRVTLRRSVAPRFNTSAEYTIDLGNPIYTEGVPEEALTSTGFYHYGAEEIHYLRDDGVGNIMLYHIVTSGSTSTIKVVEPKIGTIDYTTGLINIKNLNITAIVGSNWDLIIKPQSSDVVSAYTQIATIDLENTKITAIADKTVNGDLRAGKNYVFTSSAK